MFGLRGGRTFTCTTGISQPAPAAAAGFNCLALYDDFTNVAQTVDLNATDAPGFLWYPGLFNRAAWDNNSFVVTGAIAAGNITQHDPTTMRIKNNVGQANFQGLTSATMDSTNQSIVGQTFPNGFYFQARMRFDPTLVNNSGSWVALACTTMPGKPGFFSNPSLVPFTELDLFEAFPTGGTSYSNLMSVNYVTKLDAGGSTNNSNSNSAVTLSNGDGLFHVYGTLWQTIGQGGGTGSIKRYFDAAEVVSGRITYTAAGSPENVVPNAYANLDGSSNTIALYPGFGSWYSDLDSVEVWTL